MRWFVTGDTHGRLDRIYSWIERMNFDSEDINVIIAGDAGICWRKDGRDMDAAIRKHEQYKFHLWFIDGNHENFDILDSLPKDENGIVNLCNNLHYITRGSVIKFNNKTILCCGGADSIDRGFRTPHLNWWAQEQVTEEDIKKCLSGDNYYDYIITHCCPYSVFYKYTPSLVTIPWLDQSKIDHTSEHMLDAVAASIQCESWIFGHYHVDIDLDSRYRCILNDFLEL